MSVVTSNDDALASRIVGRESATIKDGSTVRSEFANYVPHTLNRTVQAYCTSVFGVYRTNV